MSLFRTPFITDLTSIDDFRDRDNSSVTYTKASLVHAWLYKEVYDHVMAGKNVNNNDALKDLFAAKYADVICNILKSSSINTRWGTAGAHQELNNWQIFLYYVYSNFTFFAITSDDVLTHTNLVVTEIAPENYPQSQTLYTLRIVLKGRGKTLIGSNGNNLILMFKVPLRGSDPATKYSVQTFNLDSYCRQKGILEIMNKYKL